MLTRIKTQSETIVKIVGVVLFFKALGLFRSITSSVSFFDSDIPTSITIRSVIYFVLILIPFIFLIQFYAHLKQTNQDHIALSESDNMMMSLKNAFEQLKIYFMVLIGAQVVRLGMDVFSWGLGWI